MTILGATLLPELLVKIFLHNKEVSMHSYYESLYGTSQFDEEAAQGQIDTRNASQVCRHWRATALSNPILWADMANNVKETPEEGQDEWINAVFRRCKDSVPLRAAVAFPAKWPLDSDGYRLSKVPFKPSPWWKVLFANLHQIEELDIRIGNGDPNALAYFQKRLKQPAPKLKTLKLSVTGSNYENTYFLTLPTPFVHQNTRLERVEFYRIGPTPEMARQSFSGLVSLVCKFSGEWTNAVLISPSQWLETLKEIPHLRELAIRQPIWSKDWSTPPVEAAVELPQLSNLHLSLGIIDAGHLLSRLKFPFATHVQLFCYDVASGPHYQRIFSYLSQHHDYLSQGRIPKRIWMSVKNDGSLQLDVFMEEERPHLRLNLDIMFRESYYPSEFEPPITDWMTQQLKEVEHVAFCQYPSDGSRLSWNYECPGRQLLMPFKRARRLTTDSLGTLMEVFKRDEYDSAKNGNAQGASVVLPNLNDIRLSPKAVYRWHIPENRKDPPVASDSPEESQWPEIVRFISRRRDARCPIHSIDLIPADPPQEKFEEFCNALRDLGVYVYDSRTEDLEGLERRLTVLIHDAGPRLCYE